MPHNRPPHAGIKNRSGVGRVHSAGGEQMGDVLDFQEIDQTQVAVVGGKGALLGELSRIEGIRVPAGFCVTADAFQRILAGTPSIGDRVDRLSRRGAGRPGGGTARSARRSVRRLKGSPSRRIWRRRSTRALARFGEHAAYAVRSSATAEDLPTASFAGQYDTYLNVVGPAAILGHMQPMLGLALHRAGRDLPTAQRLRPPGRSAWPWSCSRWSFRRRPASCSRPIPSPPTGRSFPSRPASAWARPWSPGW